MADSMKKLLILEDRSSEEEEGGSGALRPAHQLVRPEVRDSPSDTAGQPGVVPSEDGDDTTG